ncbi:hypothetical protein [Streptomyces virginiae]|uniref:Bacterial type II secretion system protein E domain-containing protein n=1 Tax=Streptomyces virginiae TaxID=1961 RepID=A0ABZ1T640_STRVG|nr:hypothetical protein [Streptomyces virginiae]
MTRAPGGAETRHLVLATLHTNDASQTPDRIVDVFPAGQQPQTRLQLAHTPVGALNRTRIPRSGGAGWPPSRSWWARRRSAT